jgi:YtcA family
VRNKFIRHCPSHGVALLPLLLSGCTRAPTFDIAGSLFPAWLVCLAIGISLAAISHWLLSRKKISIALPVLVYPCLAALFTFLLWLIFFSR